MHYEADYGLFSIVESQEKRLTYNGYYISTLFIFGTIMLYFIGGSVFDVTYFLDVAVCFFAMAFMLYLQIIPFSNTVNQTAAMITLSDEEIVITTVKFKVKFFIDKPAKTITLKKANLQIRAGAYPLKPVYDLPNGTIRLVDGRNEVFILKDFFEKEVTELLKNLNNT